MDEARINLTFWHATTLCGGCGGSGIWSERADLRSLERGHGEWAPIHSIMGEEECPECEGLGVTSFTSQRSIMEEKWPGPYRYYPYKTREAEGAHADADVRLFRNEVWAGLSVSAYVWDTYRNPRSCVLVKMDCVDLQVPSDMPFIEALNRIEARTIEVWNNPRVRQAIADLKDRDSPLRGEAEDGKYDVGGTAYFTEI